MRDDVWSATATHPFYDTHIDTMYNQNEMYQQFEWFVSIDVS